MTERCAIAVWSPFRELELHGPFETHQEAFDYQAKHLFRENFWFVVEIQRLPEQAQPPLTETTT